MNEALAKVRSRPGMFLYPHNTVDAASFIINFLIATCETMENNIPSSINITVANDFFYIQANDFALPFNELDENLSKLFEISSYQDLLHSNKSLTITLICPIIWFSEHCLIHTTINNKIFRQAFINGEPATKFTTNPVSGSSSFLGFFFTVSASILPKPIITLDADHLKSVITYWEKHSFNKFKKIAKHKMSLRKKWSKQSDLQYSLTITPVIETSENNTSQ